MKTTNAAVLMVSFFLGVSCSLPVSQRDVLSEVNQNSDAGQAQDAGYFEDAGQVEDAGCIPPGSLNEWPVKVLFLVESRASLCAIDPPGSTGNANTFCQLFSQAGGGTVPGRVKALQQFWAAHAAATNLWASVTWWNAGERGFSFRPVSEGLPAATGAELTNALGGSGDLEGALGRAKQRLEAEIQATSPVLRARTTYQVVVISIGVPTPICNANDQATSYATVANPGGRWADSPGSGAFCNSADASACDPLTGRNEQGAVCLPGFAGGTDRNQPAALVQLAAEIAQLKAVYGAGAVSLHTRMLFDQAQLDACGPICNDLFWLPNRDAATFAEYVLRALATAGGGSFVRPPTPLQLDLSDIEVSPVREVCSP